MKKILKWGALILVVLFVIGAISGGGKNDSSTTTNSAPTSNTQAEANQPATQTETLTGLNQEVQDGDLAFTVSKVEKKKTLGNQYTKRDAQGMFYVVTMKVENKGKKTATFDSSMAKIIDSQEREFDRSVEGQTAAGLSQGKVDLFLQQVQPSLSATGDLVFDLPADIQKPVLLVKGSLFSKGVKISLE